MPQPHKGDRKLLGTRLPLAEAHEVEHRAARMGMTVNDFLRAVVQRELEHPSITTAQEELPLATAG